MSEAAVFSTAKPGLSARVWSHPVVRILVGAVLIFVPVPVTMVLARLVADKPYRVVWPQLLAALLCFLAYRLFARRIEKRSLTEFGTAGAAREIAAGLLLGAGLVGTVFALLGALGVYRLDGVNDANLHLLLPLAELLLVGLVEEMVFRGILFRVAAQSLGPRWAILISALVFGLAHLPNEGINLIAVAAVTAYGVLQAAIYLRSGRLWLCIANHVAWNYCVGQVFSTAVSGHAATAGLLRGELLGPTLLTGGAFGVEASVITLAVISATAACVLLAPAKRHVRD